jgi:hypothetical protein
VQAARLFRDHLELEKFRKEAELNRQAAYWAFLLIRDRVEQMFVSRFTVFPC